MSQHCRPLTMSCSWLQASSSDARAACLRGSKALRAVLEKSTCLQVDIHSPTHGLTERTLGTSRTGAAQNRHTVGASIITTIVVPCSYILYLNIPRDGIGHYLGPYTNNFKYKLDINTYVCIHKTLCICTYMYMHMQIHMHINMCVYIIYFYI